MSGQCRYWPDTGAALRPMCPANAAIGRTQELRCGRAGALPSVPSVHRAATSESQAQAGCAACAVRMLERDTVGRVPIIDTNFSERTTLKNYHRTLETHGLHRTRPTHTSPRPPSAGATPGAHVSGVRPMRRLHAFRLAQRSDHDGRRANTRGAEFHVVKGGCGRHQPKVWSVEPPDSSR